MNIRHLTILAEFDMCPEATIRFGVEIMFDDGQYRARGVYPNWSGPYHSIAAALEAEARAVITQAENGPRGITRTIGGHDGTRH